jgi:hypothetical protein
MESIFANAAADIVILPPKTAPGTALGYLLGQRNSLRPAVTTAHASLDNNPVENALSPLKLGARNWLFIRHPSAGRRLANLFTLVANCRQAEVDPEAYLVDLVCSLARPAPINMGEWVPRVWRHRRALGLVS